MSYVIAAPCVADYSCVEVCPVDCISPMPDESGFEAATQLYINPELCVDCDACREAAGRERLRTNDCSCERSPPLNTNSAFGLPVLIAVSPVSRHCNDKHN